MERFLIALWNNKKLWIAAIIFAVVVLLLLTVGRLTNPKSKELPEKNENTEIIETGGTEDITIIPPVVTVDTSLGADGILLDFADENLVILHGSVGFFVYSKTEDEMVGAVNLEDIGCHYTQGDNYCEVTVEPNGTKVYLHPLSEKIMYVYDVEKKSLQKKSYQTAEMERGKVKSSPILSIS